MGSVSRTPPIRIPSGIVVPAAQRCFLLVGDRVEMLHLDTGRVLDRVDCDAEPVDADDGRVIAVRPPAAFDAGRIVELRFEDASLEVRGDHPLLDPDDLAESVPYFERAEVRTELTATTATVVADVHNRYTGGAPPGDDLLDRARFVHRTTVRLDLTSGEVIERTGERLTGDQIDEITREAPDHVPYDDAGDDAGDDDTDVTALPEGAVPVAAVARRMVYRTVEIDPERAVEQHYLHVAGPDTPAGGWRHLIAEVRHTPPPPPPP